MKRISINVLLLGASIILSVLVLEGILRFTAYKDVLATVKMPQHYFQSDREMGFDIARNFSTSSLAFAEGAFPIWSNDLGCFDTPYKNETPYIYLAGDSFTWGFAPFEDKWGTLLEKGLGVRTLKCGVGGMGPKQEYIKAERLFMKVPAPKLIVLGYFRGNDLEDDATFPGKLVYDGWLIKKLEDRTLSYDEMQARLPARYELGRKYCMGTMPANPTLQEIKCFLTKNSIVYNLTKNSLKQFISTDSLRNVGVVNEAAPDNLTITPQDIANHFANIAKFKDLAQKEHSDLLVVLIPPKEDVMLSATSSDPNADLKKFLDSKHVAYLDLRPGFQKVDPTGDALYWQRDPHWNIRGNHLASYLIEKRVLEMSPWVKDKNTKLVEVEKEMKNEFGG